MQLKKIQNLSDLPELSVKPIALLRQTNQREVEVNITALIIEICSIFKVDDNKSLTDEEIKEMLPIIYKEYYTLNWNDFLDFQRMVKMGKFGKIYGAFDMPTFFQWLDIFFEQKTQRVAEAKIKETVRINAEPISEETQRMIKDFLNKNKKIREPQEIKIDERQKIINEWVSDFKKSVGNLSGFLDINGKKMGINEYLNYRNEYNNKEENL